MKKNNVTSDIALVNQIAKNYCAAMRQLGAKPLKPIQDIEKAASRVDGWLLSR